MIEVQLKKGKEKSLLRRHPWVYDTAVGRVAGKPDSGETVKVTAADGRFFMKGTGPQRAEPPALKICIKKLLPKGNQSSDKRTIKRSKDLQR